jgi:uncharacterized protein
MILQTTLTIAAAAALLHIWLSVRVGQVRRAARISIGAGGHEGLERRMRAHANFAENAPIFLILLFLLELGRAAPLLLWAAGILFILARILHAFGMDAKGVSKLRMIGISLSWVLLLALAVWAIVLSYQSPGLRGGLQLTPARAAEAPILPRG